ncbi:DUF2946 family protein [Variovorax sp. GT1P44]|uniref:DUF2946 family protein n=1 Tax=Variovorax sp. GT1P44 TaxID=3443742 RepID=UPI003F46D765
MVRLRAVLLWLVMLAVPFQGYAAVAMAFCAPSGVELQAGLVHDHASHDHAASQTAHEHEAGDQASHQHHQDDQGASHKCGNCAACHSVGMTPTLEPILLKGLPQADLLEPFYPVASISPPVPQKPPRV